jgi:4-hydroxy-2-oxoglutarate aldolase
VKQAEQENALVDSAASGAGLRGLLLPVTTPFYANGDIDHAGLQSNLAKWNEKGITGYVALGSTGERVHLSEREYVHVIEVAREVTPRELTLIVGAGQQSTRGTMNDINIAAQAGADSVLVITPHYYRPAITQDALIDHYLAVADAAPVPVILYSMPALTGIKIEPETVARLSEHENIIGVKDSSADIEELEKTVALVRARNDFAVLTGNGTVLYQALRAGADGAILAVGCIAPQLCLDIFRSVTDGEHETAASLQTKLTPVARAVTTQYGIGGLKVALDMIGYAGGIVRAPLRSPNQEARRDIQRMLSEAGLLLADKQRHPMDQAVSTGS